MWPMFEYGLRHQWYGTLVTLSVHQGFAMGEVVTRGSRNRDDLGQGIAPSFAAFQLNRVHDQRGLIHHPVMKGRDNGGTSAKWQFVPFLLRLAGPRHNLSKFRRSGWSYRTGQLSGRRIADFDLIHAPRIAANEGKSFTSCPLVILAAMENETQHGPAPEAALDEAAERWRMERRQLKAEIDRLESASAEKFREAAKEWEAERAKLRSEVSRLQNSVGELLERSNNPKRVNMSVREELETKLHAAIQAKDRAVSGYLHEKAAWEDERNKMQAELHELRLGAARNRAPRGKLNGDDRAKELETRIAALQKEVESERAAARIQIQRLERQIADSRQATVAEIARIQKMAMDITKQVSDPATDLTTVIRKNVELAELNAYLKGIQFQPPASKPA